MASTSVDTYSAVKALVMKSESNLSKLVPDEVKDQIKPALILDQLHHQLKNSKNAEKLMACEPATIAAAIKYCCQMGLEPGWGNGTPDVYLIPYGKDCQTQLSYAGELKLARRQGKFKNVYSDVVYSGDEFEAWNDMTGQHFKHKKVGFENRTTENIVAVYAAALTNEGDPYLEIMTVEQIDMLEKKTRKGQSQSPAWRDWWDQMARKTVLRRVIKNLPQSREQSLAESLDNQSNIIDVETKEQNVKQLTTKDVIG